MKRLIISLTIITTLIVSCTKSDKLNENSFRISGKLSNAHEKQIYLIEMTPEKFKNLDSISIDKEGNFSLTYPYKEPTIYLIQTNENDYITMIPKGNEDIIIKADYPAFANTYEIKNSPESELLYELNKEYIKSNAALRHIKETLHNNFYDANIAQIKKGLLERYDTLEAHQKESMRTFIEKNVGSLACCIALYRTFDNRPIFDFQKDLTMYEKVLEGLNKKHPNNPHTIALKNHIDNIKKLEQNKSLASNDKK